jgi:F-type H+-transporting ATPase subunit delta
MPYWKFLNTNGVTKVFHLLFETKICSEAVAVEYSKLFDIMNGVEVAQLLQPSQWMQH